MLAGNAKINPTINKALAIIKKKKNIIYNSHPILK
jgi:hypothetical protein